MVTDHKPLCTIFNENRKGSIRIERIKLRHQDIRFQVQYQRGKENHIDFISRRAKPRAKIPKDEQVEAEDLNNLLYILHTTPIMDNIGLATIAKQTKEDKVLAELVDTIKQGKTWIPKTADPNLRMFKPIIPEITTTYHRQWDII